MDNLEPKENEILGNPETGKQELLREILTRNLPSHQLPEAFFSYSGGIVERRKDLVSEDTSEVDRFKTMSYTDIGEHGLITGGKARVLATAECAKTFPDMNIIATSKYYADWPTHAAIIKDELVRHGVQSDQISLEENSFSTITELVEMMKLTAKNNWQRIVAITNEYHLPRIQEMLNQLDQLFAQDTELQEALRKFRDCGGEVALISAEEVLSSLDDRWKNLIEAARETEPYKKTVAAEQRGLKDLMEGKYIVSAQPKELPKGGS